MYFVPCTRAEWDQTQLVRIVSGKVVVGTTGEPDPCTTQQVYSFYEAQLVLQIMTLVLPRSRVASWPFPLAYIAAWLCSPLSRHQHHVGRHSANFPVVIVADTELPRVARLAVISSPPMVDFTSKQTNNGTICHSLFNRFFPTQQRPRSSST